MEPLLQRLLNILIAPPGNLVFHLVLAFSILASLQAVWIARQSSSYKHSGRMLLGLSLLMFAQLALFLSSGLAWQGVVDPHLLLPPLDRAVIVFSLVWIVWLWAFPKEARLGDLVTGFLVLGVFVLFVFTFISWSQQGQSHAFNNYWIDWVWELAGLFIVLTGMAVLIFSRPDGWGFGLGMLSVSLAGFVAHLAVGGSSGDFSGFIRLSQLAAYPLLPTLLNRLNVPRVERPAATAPSKTAPTPGALQVERRRYSSDSRTVHAFLELKEKDDPQKVPPAMAKAIAHTMLADICYIITVPEYGQIALIAGYDLVREEEVGGTFLDQNQVPVLATALQKGKGLRIVSGDSQPDDMRVIAGIRGLQEPGTLLLVPLGIGDKPWGGVLLLSPYSSKQWTVEDLNYLASESERIVSILNQARERIQESASRQQSEDQIKALSIDLALAQTENQKLAQQLEEARRDWEERGQKPGSAPDLEALIALQKESQDAISTLQAENESLKRSLHEAALPPGGSPDAATTVELMRMEADLRATLQDLAFLQNQLADANARVLTLERESATSVPGFIEDRDVFTSMIQDLRQPMVSIMGYTDLLLSESVGILGSLQRKFLERTRASAERMRLMLNDLIQMNTLGASARDLLHRPIELGAIIDGAMLDTSAQLREKDITLRVDLPRELPLIHTGRDTIQQILVHLLQNAGAATPQEGTITLRARVQADSSAAGQNGQSTVSLLIQIIDSGGGIPPESIDEVFTPRYRAEKPLVQGLGDTGVGLSITKSLVESQGGRIWVESEAGKTTTFNVQLPINTNALEKATG